jgi:type II secretory pathway component PulF
MPYYAWRSVNEVGDVERGASFALSEKELDAALLAQRKALIASRTTRRRGRSRRLKRFLYEDFFSHFAHLMRAGVLVPDALELCACQATNQDVRQVLHALSVRVKGGMALSDALSVEEGVFSPVIVTMVRAGEESGSLAPVAEVIAFYAANDADFKKRLHAALLGPLVTFVFFMVIAVVFLVVAVPQFASMMATMGIEMPSLTKTLVAIQRVLTSWLGIVVGLGFVGLVFGVRYFAKRWVSDDRVQAWLLAVPFYGAMVKLRSVTQISRALSLLLQNGVAVPDAFCIAQGAVSNFLIQKRIADCEELVRAGYSVSAAMEAVGEGWWSSDASALVRMGEESGRLGPQFEHIACRAQSKLDASLMRIATLVQPLAMLFLGCLVALLIAAIYVPLLEMAKVV